MLKSIRVLLAIVVYFDYEIWQMDVKIAFLNGNIEEELYMVQPKGFVDPNDANKVCKIQRSIYGLKQASRRWNLCFDEVIKGFEFVQNTKESCIYKKMSESSFSFLLIYVDDILLIGNDVQMLNNVKQYLNIKFSMKDMGEATYVLGIKIYRDRSRRLLALSKSTYLDKVMKRFRMEDSKKGSLPIMKGVSLSVTQCPATEKEKSVMSNILLCLCIGSIMYAMLSTRPNVALDLSLMSRYQSNPGISHWSVVKNILKFLRRTKDMVLVYGGSGVELDVKGYVNMNYKADLDDKKSQTGYMFFVNGGAVCWRSYKKSLKAKSTLESEYIVAADAANEVVWLQKFVIELGVLPGMRIPIHIYCDDTVAIAKAKELWAHSVDKPILRRSHVISDYVKDDRIRICKAHRDLNVTDPLTKPLTEVSFDPHQHLMGVRSLPILN
jgi:hypothetical protein